MKTQVVCILILGAIAALCEWRAIPPGVDYSQASPGPLKADEEWAALQRAYQESLRRQCLAADGTPNCQHIQDEQRRQLEQRLEEMKRELCAVEKCLDVIPIPPEHPRQHALKKAGVAL